MFNYFSKRPFYNKKFSDYCMKSNMEYIRKLTKSYKENLMYRYNNKLLTNNNNNNNNNNKLLTNNVHNTLNSNNIFIFLSISSFLYYYFGCK